MNAPESILITGASGLVGRHLLEELKDEYRLFAIARRSQQECGAPTHPNIAWMRADIADYYGIGQAMREIATAGGADIVIHLAAFYDFSSKSHPEYYRTNIGGTRNILNLSQELNPRLFIFTSSVAACAFPEPGSLVREDSPPDGDHAYSHSKREGERMMLDNKNTLHSCVLRLGAVYTDWCEYAPLYVFLKTWLEESWRSRILGGKGHSAIPYIHIRDVITCIRAVIAASDGLPDKTVLHASTAGSTSHRRLYQVATRYYFGKERRPLCMPAFVAGAGLRMMHVIKRLVGGKKPFEQPWMLRYIDKALDVSIDRSRRQLQWSPNPRHAIERRIPYLLERLKSEPIAWHLRNVRAMQKDPDRPELRLYTTLSALEYSVCDNIVDVVHADHELFPTMSASHRDETLWYVRLLYRLILSSIHSGNKMLPRNYFEMTVENKLRAGSSVSEIVALLERLNLQLHETAKTHHDLKDLEMVLQHSVSLPIEFAIDEVQSRESIPAERTIHESIRHGVGEDERPDARAQLEQTIWDCLVFRK